MAGFSDAAMRSICLSLGAGLAFTEMVSCKGLLYDNRNTVDLIRTADNERIKCVQIFGNDPEIMRRAAELPALEKFDVVDVNFGCPMPKIFNNGEGSALLADPKKAEKIISELKKTGKTVTCKMRTGLKQGHPVTRDFAVAVEQGGADMITIHGRTRDRIYSGEVDFDEIAKAKAAVGVPVIANGGIFSERDADVMLDRTGADGVMIARAALENPFIFSEIARLPVTFGKKTLIYRYIALLKEYHDDKTVAVNFRKQLCLYLKGEKNSNALKNEILRMTSTDEVLSAVNIFFAE